MNDKEEIFIREFVILFGFFNGVWLKVGINPEAELWGIFKIIADMINPEMTWLIMIMPFILLIITFLFIWALGGLLGILSVGIAFVAGLLILSVPLIGIFMLVIAAGIGIFAIRNREN